MRALVLSLLLALAAPAWGATWYVTATGAGATNGTSLANAFAGWADIPANTFVAGDVLCVVGELNSDTTMAFTDAGSAGNPIIIAGDCPEGAGILDGNNTAAPVLKLGEAGLAASYVRVRGLTIRDSHPSLSTADCILDSSLGAGGGFNEFVNLTVTDCGMSAINMQKPNPTISGGTYSYCGDDCIGVNTLATNPTIRGATIEFISTRTTTGDGIAIYNTPAPSNVIVENNTCYWDYTGKEKSCFILGVSSGDMVVRGNTLIARVPVPTNHAISITAGTNVYVERNYCKGWNACITHYSTDAEGIDSALYVRSNIASESQYAVLFTTSVGTPSLYAENNSGGGLVNGLRATATVAANLFVRNNAFRLDGSGGDALYVSNSYNSYTGSSNNFGPEGASFIENYKCGGGTYATAAAYVAACAQEVGTTSSVPGWMGGDSPDSVMGFCLTPDSPLLGAGTYIGAYATGYRGKDLGKPPAIGAMALCRARAIAADRPAATTRPTH